MGHEWQTGVARRDCGSHCEGWHVWLVRRIPWGVFCLTQTSIQPTSTGDDIAGSGTCLCSEHRSRSSRLQLQGLMWKQSLPIPVCTTIPYLFLLLPCTGRIWIFKSSQDAGITAPSAAVPTDCTLSSQSSFFPKHPHLRDRHFWMLPLMLKLGWNAPFFAQSQPILQFSDRCHSETELRYFPGQGFYCCAAGSSLTQLPYPCRVQIWKSSLDGGWLRSLCSASWQELWIQYPLPGAKAKPAEHGHRSML